MDILYYLRQPKVLINILLIVLVIGSLYIILNNNETYKNNKTKTNTNIGIVTTVKNPHQINDWINYHLDIGIKKIYIISDDPEEDLKIIPDNRIVIFKNNSEWRNKLKDIEYLKMFYNKYDTEVMSRQILNFAHVRDITRNTNLNWLLHIDCDELFYLEGKDLNQIFNDNYDIIRFKNYEMIPENDSYQNCFREGTKFLTNKTKYIAYSNGKSAVKINSDAIIAGVHGFTGGRTLESEYGKILHYPSCNFEEYIRKYKILENFEDKWWGLVQIPIKFHLESRDLINSCKNMDEVCIKKMRQYYNDKHVYNNKLTKDDYIVINRLMNI